MARNGQPHTTAQDLLGTVQLNEIRWPQVHQALDHGIRTVVVAVGSTEQHGPHLPLMTDARIGELLASAVATRLGTALAAPTLPFGVASHHMPFPGTVSLSPQTFKNTLTEYLESIASHGFETICVLSSHGGNFSPLAELLESLNHSIGQTQIIGHTDLQEFFGIQQRMGEQFGVSAEASGAHAGEAETAIMLSDRPELVDMGAAEAGFVGELTEEVLEGLFASGMPAVSEIGVIGDPRPATGAHGSAYLEALTDHLAEFFQAKMAG